MSNVTKTLDKLPQLKQALSAIDKQVIVGVLSDDKRSDSLLTNSEIGYIHEFGAPEANISPSPFLIPGVRDAMPTNIDLAFMALSKMLQLKSNPNVIINNLGNDIGNNSVESVQNKIDEQDLIDTGQLRESITYEVKDAD